MHSNLEIFTKLYKIKDSEHTISDVVDSVLLRLDSDKEIKTIGLAKTTSVVKPTESNQLLKGVVTVFTNEMECLINIWN